MTWKRVGKWSAGYVRQRVGPDGALTGKPVWVIEKWIDGERFHVSTRATSPEAAERQLVRFEANPAAYSPAGETRARSEVRFTAELIDQYGEHQEAKGLTGDWVDEMGRCLTAWLEVLGDVDLKRLDISTVKEALATWPKRRSQRIKALKGFYRWLRFEKGLIAHAEDVALNLRVPQAAPEKWKRRKVVDPEDVQAVLKHLKAPFNDILHLLTATAWHITEVKRFRASGEIVEATGTPGVLAVLITRHKGGELARSPLQFQEHLETAQRIKAWKGAWPKPVYFQRAMKKACAEAKVPYFGMGVMRHSVLTWGHNAGASMASLAEFALHKSEATTRRFYVDQAVPTNVIPIRRFQR